MRSFKARLDGAHCNLILGMSLLTAEALDWMTSRGLFQPKTFFASMILGLVSSRRKIRDKQVGLVAETLPSCEHQAGRPSLLWGSKADFSVAGRT